MRRGRARRSSFSAGAGHVAAALGVSSAGAVRGLQQFPTSRHSRCRSGGTALPHRRHPTQIFFGWPLGTGLNNPGRCQPPYVDHHGWIDAVGLTWKHFFSKKGVEPARHQSGSPGIRPDRHIQAGPRICRSAGSCRCGLHHAWVSKRWKGSSSEQAPVAQHLGKKAGNRQVQNRDAQWPPNVLVHRQPAVGGMRFDGQLRCCGDRCSAGSTRTRDEGVQYVSVFLAPGAAAAGTRARHPALQLAQVSPLPLKARSWAVPPAAGRLAPPPTHSVAMAFIGMGASPSSAGVRISQVRAGDS